MSGFKSIAKGGWHPKGKGEGGKEGWRSDFKGANTVAGWMGKGKDTNLDAVDHQSAPISTLKDPSSFGPPPKRTLAGSSDSSGLGAPVPTPTRQQRQAEAEAEEEANKPPPGPYKVNTTGIDPTTLPKPPVRRLGQALSPPPSRGTTPNPKPKLPPRLPPRQTSHPDVYAENPPPTYNESSIESAPAQGYLNQSALDRLGKSGVSVPGFNISRTTSPPILRHQNASPSNSNQPLSSAPVSSRGPQLAELQSRFTNMSTHSTEKRTPLPTLNSTSNFLSQGGEQSAPARRTASTLAQKYGIANVGIGPASPTVTTTASPLQSPTHGGIGKKPPPPPPPKKKELVANSIGGPPPIPLGSKPKF